MFKQKSMSKFTDRNVGFRSLSIHYWSVLFILACTVTAGCKQEQEDALLLAPAEPTSAKYQPQRTDNCGDIPETPADVSQASVIREWSDRIKTFIECLRSANINAHEYKRILTKITQKQDQLKKQRNEHLIKLRLEEHEKYKQELVTKLKQKILDEANKVRDPLLNQLAKTKHELFRLEKLLAEHEADLKTMQGTYSDIVHKYLAYRNTEIEIFNQLNQIALDGSKAAIDDIAQLNVKLVNISKKENSAPQSLIIEAKRQIWFLNEKAAAYEKSLEPFRSLMKEEGIASPDFLGDSVPALEKMIGYCENRMQRVNQTIASLLTELEKRNQALINLKADEATRKTLAQAATLDAATKFLSDITEREKTLWKLPPQSNVLKLYFLAAKHAEYESFLQLKALCKKSQAATAWMKDGCGLISSSFAKIDNYLSKILPMTIRMNVGMMRNAGVPEQLLTQIEADLNQGDLASAVEKHDTALRISEQVVP